MKKIFFNVGHVEYFIRHLYNFYPYITPRKIANLVLNYAEFKFKVTQLRSLPPYIKVEPTALCHLRCPGCRHSEPGYNEQLKPSMRISLNEVKMIIEPLADCLLGVSLSNHGEPLLHKDLSSLIRYLHNRNIAVSFPTNLSVKMGDKAIEDLATSGADTLFVSLDGASQETYIQYRVGGKFDLVKSNVQRLQAVKQKLGLKRPRLVWKFVIFEHNKHELETARNSFRLWGFDSIEFVMDCRASSTVKARKEVRSKATQIGCFWPWHTMMVDWNGEIAPCCTHSDFGLGNAIATNSAEIWRSEKYRELRNGFRDLEKINPICARCLGIATTNHIKGGAYKRITGLITEVTH